MTQIQLELFSDKTRRFLYSKTNNSMEIKRPSARHSRTAGHHSELAVLNNECDLRGDNQLVDISAKRIEEASRFSALVIQMDEIPDELSEEFWAQDTLLADHVTSFFSEIDAFWGRLAPGRFECIVISALAGEAMKLAERFQKSLLDTGSISVSIGISGYPMVNYPKDMILENAFKALDHAEFFGPSSIVCFDAVSLNISGDRLYEEGDIKGAINEFTHALMINPSDVNVHNSLGVCYGMAGMLEKAMECFDHAKWLDPDNAMAYYNTGLIHLLSGDSESALDQFLGAEKIDGNVFETMLQIGKLYLDRTELEKARFYLEKAQKLNHDSALIHRFMGDCYMEMNLAGKAVETYTKAIKKNPNDAHSLSALGCLYIEEGKNEEIATVFCRQSVDISPDSGLFRYRLGKVYMKQDKIKEALEAFKLAAELGQDTNREISQAESLLMEKAS